MLCRDAHMNAWTRALKHTWRILLGRSGSKWVFILILRQHLWRHLCGWLLILRLRDHLWRGLCGRGGRWLLILASARECSKIFQKCPWICIGIQYEFDTLNTFVAQLNIHDIMHNLSNFQNKNQMNHTTSLANSRHKTPQKTQYITKYTKYQHYIDVF